jgi:hypothetical protein
MKVAGIKLLISAVFATAALGLASSAAAEPYQDYTPAKGAWQFTEATSTPAIAMTTSPA